MDSTIRLAKRAPRMMALVACLSVWASALHSAESRPAPGASDLKIELQARKVVRDRQGKETLQPADRALPGEVVQYDAIYRNQSDQPLRQVEPTLPIPRGMVYLPNSASPPPVLASLDGRTFEPIPIRRKVIRPDGTEEEREVPATEYRALRWRISELQAGAQVTVTARAKIIPPRS